MTRKEEIQMQAEKKALEPSRLMHPYAKQHKVMSAYEIGFIEGAVWADAHPDIDVRTMAAWQSGYKEAIEKACEWLRTNLCEHYADEPIAHKMGRPISGYISFFEEPPVAVIGDFRKAMEGGEK